MSEQRFDEMGNPMVRVGCENCGKGLGWMNPISYSAILNSGRQPAGPCSRACSLQLEYARDRRAVREEMR